MMNKELFLSAATNRLMNKALTIIAEEAFFSALPYSFGDLTKENKLDLHNYVGAAIEHFGGARTMLNDAMRRYNTKDQAKYLYTKSMYDVCLSTATEAAKRVTEEVDVNDDYTTSLEKANFTEEEFKKFETNADKLDLEDVGNIIKDKVIATIRSEQEAYATEKKLDEEILEIVAGESEEPEAGVESFYKVALSSTDARHHVSLFSKLVEVAVESIMSMYPEEGSKELSTKALHDVTFLYSLDSYKEDLDATEAINRLVNMDAMIINDNEYQEIAIEGMTSGNISTEAFVVGATAYTLMETLKTLNLVNPEKREIEKFINTSHRPADYGNMAVESFINKSNSIFNWADNSIRKATTVEEVNEFKSFLNDIRHQVEGIGIASESFVDGRTNFLARVDKSLGKIEDKLASFGKTKKEMSSSEKIAFEQDLAAINRLHAVYGKRTDGDHFVFSRPFGMDDHLNFEYVNAMESPLITSGVNLIGSPESVDDYIADLIKASNFVKNGAQVKVKSQGVMINL